MDATKSKFMLNSAMQSKNGFKFTRMTESQYPLQPTIRITKNGFLKLEIGQLRYKRVHHQRRKLNKEPDSTFKGSFNVRISSELHRNVAATAKEQGVSLNHLVSEALENYIG